MGWRDIEEQEESQNQNSYGKPFSLHHAHLLNKNIYTPSHLRKQGSTDEMADPILSLPFLSK
jgi:hypothetical protein